LSWRRREHPGGAGRRRRREHLGGAVRRRRRESRQGREEEEEELAARPRGVKELRGGAARRCETDMESGSMSL
jgi:hypothetical protein